MPEPSVAEETDQSGEALKAPQADRSTGAPGSQPATGCTGSGTWCKRDSSWPTTAAGGCWGEGGAAQAVGSRWAARVLPGVVVLLRPERNDWRPTTWTGDACRVPNQTRVAAGDVTLVVRTWPGTEELRPPVVLLPATAETAEDWDVVASALSGSRIVHAVTLRGHGRSDWPGAYSIQLLADDVTALLLQLADWPVDLVAHSLGGLVACAVASAHADLLHRLVLEDVGLLRPRLPTLPAIPAGVLAFDWRMVEQVRPQNV